MRPLFSLLLLTAFLLPSCAQSSPEPHPTLSPPPLTPPLTSPPPTRAATTVPLTPSPTVLLPTPTGRSTATPAAFTFQQGTSLPLDGPLIAYEAGGAQDKTLLLADPAESTIYQLSIPATARFATPFLAGLSPDTRYFVYFEGGWLETLYDFEHLRASTPDLVLHILDLRSGEVIFSTPLLSPSFPQDLAQIAETIKDEPWFKDHPFKDVVAATQEELLDYIRNVAWSPDSSLLAFASQNPGPSSDLYLFSTKSGTARGVTKDPAHVLHTIWAPDSSALVLITSFYDRQAREDTTYLLSRDGSTLTSFTSQVWSFREWHDSTLGFLYGATDSGDNFDLKTISAADGTINMLYEGSFGYIAYSPDLSTFLISRFEPGVPSPPYPGLFLGRREDGSLVNLSKKKGWEIAYWGSEKYAFAASSIDGGTIGVTPEGEVMTINAGYWSLAASPGGSNPAGGSYLAGYNLYRPGYIPGVVAGLRIFDGNGLLLESIGGVNVTCVRWNAEATALAYQVESRLYLWETPSSRKVPSSKKVPSGRKADSGSTRLISDQLNEEECAFQWVRDTP